METGEWSTLEVIMLLLGLVGSLALLCLVSLAVTGGRLLLGFGAGVWMNEPVDEDILARAYTKLGIVAVVCFLLLGMVWIVNRWLG